MVKVHQRRESNSVLYEVKASVKITGCSDGSHLVLLHELLDCLQSGTVLLRHGHREALLDPQLQQQQHNTKQ